MQLERYTVQAVLDHIRLSPHPKFDDWYIKQLHCLLACQFYIPVNLTPRQCMACSDLHQILVAFHLKAHSECSCDFSPADFLICRNRAITFNGYTASCFTSKPFLPSPFNFTEIWTVEGSACLAVKSRTVHLISFRPFLTQSSAAHISSRRCGARHRCNLGPPLSINRLVLPRDNWVNVPLVLSKTTEKPFPLTVTFFSFCSRHHSRIIYKPITDNW